MNEHDEVIWQVRESFSGLHMDRPVEKVIARSRVRRRRRLSGLTAAAATAAGAAAAITLTPGGLASALSGPTPAHSGTPSLPSKGSAELAAFSVTNGPGGSTTLTLYKGPKDPQLDPTALREALARHGIPALVTVGTFCRSTPEASASLGQVVHASNLADGSAMVINGQAMPSGTELSIGYFEGHVRMTLIEDGASLSCSSTFQQPAVHITPSGTPIRERQ
jgi:hypothetical protein